MLFVILGIAPAPACKQHTEIYNHNSHPRVTIINYYIQDDNIIGTAHKPSTDDIMIGIIARALNGT